MRRLLLPPVHQFFDALRVIGLRDRLRCPECFAVGTWKPHGGWLDGRDKRKVRRWLCKWCGHYLGPEGEARAHFDGELEYWRLDAWPEDAKCTPQHIVRATADVDPWRG